ncbi:MAG: fibronectin type III domain-containing protein [Phycisphaerae bacterium]|nr:fibronectin type III domain-containing protein [Phycisphaerae bacterium]
MTGCTFTNIYPMRLSDPENVGGLAGFSGNTYPQNAKIYIYGQVDGAVTLSSVDGLVGYLLWSYLTVADGALLTINPGIEIYSTGSSGEFRVYGQMNADGATFIGGYTDIIAYDGGMVNLTGCIQESAYLQCNSGSNVTASNCELVYVSLTGGVPTVTGCTFTNIYPMHLSDPDNVGGLAGFSGNTYPQNAKIYIYGQVDGAVTLSSVDGLVGYLLVSYLTVADGALLTINPGIEIYSTGSSGEFRVYGQMNADGATFIGGYTDIIAYDGGMVNLTGCIQESAYLQCNSGSDVTASNCELVYISLTGGVPTVTGCTFTNIYPMHLSDPDNVGGLAGFSGNTYPQNAKIYIYGQVDGTVMLSSVDGLVGYLLWSYLTVAEGALLTINPGVEIHSAGSSGEIRVYGQMYADGATFIGGYTDIVAYDGCMVNLTNCVQDGGSVRFNTGGGGALGCNQLKSVVIYSGANPLIANNDFSQGSVSVNGDSGVWIDLENNWWGTTDPGQIEAKITDCNDNPDLPCVDYVPFLDDVPTGCEPPEPPSGEQIHVGQLTITGEVVTQINGSLWQISGNAWINDLLRLTGSVTANTATLTVNGNGQIWLDNVTGLGNVKLYEGPWEFDGQAAATTTINTVLSGLEVVGLDVEVYSVSIQPNGVRLQGHLLMPDLLNEARLEISGSDYILVTRTGRLEWSGAAITIPDAEGLAFMGMPFNVSSVMLHVSPDELQVRGTLELPALLGGTTIDLSTDQNHLSITEAAGQPQVDIVGSLMMDGPIVIGPGFSLADMVFTLDTVQEILQGDGTLNVPAGYGIVAGIGFRQGYFNYIHAGVTNMGIIIVTGPPPALVPIVYWQDVEAWMDELAPGPPPIVFGGAMAFTAGPQIESYYLARLNLTAEYDTGGRFTGTGQVLLGGGDDPFEFASAVVILDKTYGMHVTGHMSYVGVLDVDGSLRIDLYNNMQGKFVGTIHVPAWMGGVDLADATLYGQYYDDSDDTNDYFIAAVRMLFGFESAVKFDIHTGEVDWHADMGLIVEVDVPPGGRGSLPVAFDLPAGLEGALFRAEWDTGDTDLHLIRPGSTLITPDNVDDFADVKYFKDAGTNGLQAMYAVAQPEVGQWQVDLTNSNGIGGYRIQQFNTTDRPVITLLEPSADTSQTTVAITWADADSDSDAVISLYYDTDRQGAGGTEIVTGISEDASTNSFVWDTTGVPAGAYYVHARIDDGQNTPAVDYSIGRVVVTDPAAPGAPTGLAAVAGETSGEIRLAWAAGSGAVDHYVVGVTTDPAGERYETLSAGSQETDTTLTGLVPGRRYRLAVAAVDADDRKSGFSEPIIVTLTDAMNNLPVFVGGIATRATVGQLYQSQVLATDLDGHTISYDLAGEPAGMTVSGSGLVEWAPTADQIGDHTFEVLLDDGHAGSNGLAFTINVADTGGPNRPPEILSHAPVPAQPGAQYGYQLVVDDPEAGDGRFHDLLVAPAGASVSGSGLIQCDVPGGSGRYDFLVRVRDDHGLYDLQRFTIQADADVPTINASDWGTAASPASDTIAIEADPVPDATGLIELQLEVDGTPGAWQLASTWATSGLSANTQHFFRLKARDASADRNESGWSGVLSAYTLADVPPVPSLVLAQETALSIGLDPGTNPAGTQLALWNVSHGEWIALDGAGSAVEVWADAATWGTVTIQSLTVDTTYHFQSKAGNEEGIETGLSEVLAAETLAPPSDALIDASTNAIYENINGLTDQQVVLTASFADDPYANSSYSYTWLAPVHPVTGKELVLVSAGGADDATAVYAAPQSPSGDLVPYEARCVITGVETGNYVMGTVQVSVAQRGDADRDGDVDLADYAMFPAHLLGPGGGLNPGGEVFDFDGDADVDLVDFAVFQMVLVEFHSSRSPLGSR